MILRRGEFWSELGCDGSVPTRQASVSPWLVLMNELSPPPPTLKTYGPVNPEGDVDERGTFRALTEAFVSLFIAVLLFRTFAAEGYMISTGSMAPCLLGFHKRVVCPTCHITFPFGTAYDTDSEADADSLSASRSTATCPNCGQWGIDVTDVPRNHGDQLLVNKQAYLYRPPARWDIVVFRNPAHPTEAYVKRAVGLPNERIQVVAGDIVANGKIARKTYQQQLATRILVHDFSFRPTDDEGYEPHWKIIEPFENDERNKSTLKWTEGAKGFQFRGGDVRRPDKTPMSWIEYHHWLRAGGYHKTAVRLEHWPEDINTAAIPNAGLVYDRTASEFSVTGALSKEIADQLVAMSSNEIFHDAVHDLYERSHIVPVDDEYGYNPPEEVGTPNPVRDLMMSAHILIQGGTGEFAMEMTNGATVFSLVFDVIRRQVHLHVEPLPEGISLDAPHAHVSDEPVASADWPAQMSSKGATVEFSIIDKQVIVAMNGKMVMAPWPFELLEDVSPPRIPARFGVRGLDVRVSDLKLFRDIYYTESRSRHGIGRPFELHEDEFFVLGDNSPVSHDSRRWERPTVNRSYLIGKPFLVHLPSKPGNLRVGNREMHLRMPDFERIRFLR